MAEITFRVCMDENLKAQFDSLCADFGMTPSAAINVFARAVVRERRIPFEIASTKDDAVRMRARASVAALRAQAKKDFPQGMSLDEINAEIRKARYGEED